MGRMKKQAADFVVEEFLSSSFPVTHTQKAKISEHALFRLRKQRLTTPQAVGMLASRLRVPKGAFSVVALKDKYADTTQHVSLSLASLSSSFDRKKKKKREKEEEEEEEEEEEAEEEAEAEEEEEEEEEYEGGEGERRDISLMDDDEDDFDYAEESSFTAASNEYARWKSESLPSSSQRPKEQKEKEAKEAETEEAEEAEEEKKAEKEEEEVDVLRYVKDKQWEAEWMGWSKRPLASSDILCNRFRVTLRDLSVKECELMDHYVSLFSSSSSLNEEDRKTEKKGTEGKEKKEEQDHEGRTLILANYFGDQRFGSARHGKGFVAKHLVRGEFEEALKLMLATPARQDNHATKRNKQLIAEYWGQWREILLMRRKQRQRFRDGTASLALFPEWKAVQILAQLSNQTASASTSFSSKTVSPSAYLLKRKRRKGREGEDNKEEAEDDSATWWRDMLTTTTEEKGRKGKAAPSSLTEADFRRAFEELPYLSKQMTVYSLQSHLWNSTVRTFLLDHFSSSSSQLERREDPFGEMVFPTFETLKREKNLWQMHKEEAALEIPLFGAKSELVEPWKGAAIKVLKEEGLQLAQLKIPGLRKPFFSSTEQRSVLMEVSHFRMSEPMLQTEDDDSLYSSSSNKTKTKINNNKQKRFSRVLEFVLPRGSYATVVLRALMPKTK